MSYRVSLIIDACVLLNLLATNLIKEILEVASQKSLVCTLVKAESLYLRKENDPTELEQIELQPLFDAGILHLCQTESDEEDQLFVNLAAKLDDGEAMSLAIALNRRWHLSTDDKKARRIFVENSDDEQLLIGTSDLVKEWADSKSISNDDLKRILQQIEQKARFRPSLSDRNYQWWNDTVK